MGNNSIFVFQMRRVGDFFQSIPLINSLYGEICAKTDTTGNIEESAKSNNGAIDILVDANIAVIKDFLINDIQLITFKDLFPADCKNCDRRDDWNDSDFLAFLGDLKYGVFPFLNRYNLVVNLNYNILSGLLSDFFDNADKKGFICLNKSVKTSEAILRRGAANYFYNSVKNRKLNRLNIIDIFSLIGFNKPAELKINYDILKLNAKKKISGAKGASCINLSDAKASEMSEIKEPLGYNNVAYNKLRICISTGASSEKRLWGTENYAKLAELLLKNFNCEITFVGTDEDVSAVSAIKELLFSRLSNPYDIDNFKNNLIDITGKTSLSELIYIIKDFDLIISTDTGTLHIAQILQVPAVSIFIGNANFYETGPHLNKSYAICPKVSCYPCLEHELCRYNFSCKNDIKSEDIFLLVAMTQWKSGSVRKELISNIKKGNSEVFLCANAGSIHYYPLIKKYINKNELASEILKYCWIYILSERSVEPDIGNILKNCKKYYKIGTATIEELLSEISFVITVFENGKLSFALQKQSEMGNENIHAGSGNMENCNTENNHEHNSDTDAVYFDRFKKAVKEIGRNYEYLKLVSDYFIDEVNFSAGSVSGSDFDLGSERYAYYSSFLSRPKTDFSSNLYSSSEPYSIGKAFDDVIMLLNTSINILKQFNIH